MADCHPMPFIAFTFVPLKNQKNMKTKELNNKPCPTIVFGDIHGSTYWKTVVAENPACRYIFLGDYLDPYVNIPRNQLIDNLKEIVQLKKDRNDDVILLLGNHDLHYIHLDIEPCTRFDEVIAKDAYYLFLDNRHLFTYAFQEENRIFTHAGISQKWFLEDFKGDVNKNIAEQLNNPHRDQLPALYRCGWFRGGDRNASGGIFWADITELIDLGTPLQGYIQFAGHNRVDEIRKCNRKEGIIFFCDCLYNEKYYKLEF